MHPVHDIEVPPDIAAFVPAVIEIPRGSHLKYEVDKPTGLLRLDRVLYSAVHYPANYGFIPRTHADDGDPLDILVIGPVPVAVGCVVRSRPIGVLIMEDDKGNDDKVLAVPTDDLHPYYSAVSSYRAMPQIFLDQVAHFFTHYKDLEKGKWAKVGRWADAGETAEIIARAIKQGAAKA